MQHEKTTLIRQFITEHVNQYPENIAKVTAEYFGISRQAVNRHLMALEKTGTLIKEGKTKARHYKLRPTVPLDIILSTENLQDDIVWQKELKPLLANTPKNIFDICYYGFTEMLNNAIDHSASPTVKILCKVDDFCVDITIADLGIGIFKKIKQALNLEDELEAIKQLAKGKLTTDPSRHTGEGIFFTSRMFDHFSIFSGSLYFLHSRPEDNWLIESKSQKSEGTFVNMIISLKSLTQIKEVFDTFTVDKQTLSFSRTRVPIRLIQYGTDTLISRSQARRLLARFDMFEEVILDFTDITEIGTSFADEVFRVFKKAHPNTLLLAVNENENVRNMINRIIQAETSTQSS